MPAIPSRDLIMNSNARMWKRSTFKKSTVFTAQEETNMAEFVWQNRQIYGSYCTDYDTYDASLMLVSIQALMSSTYWRHGRPLPLLSGCTPDNIYLMMPPSRKKSSFLHTCIIVSNKCASVFNFFRMLKPVLLSAPSWRSTFLQLEWPWHQPLYSSGLRSVRTNWPK